MQRWTVCVVIIAVTLGGLLVVDSYAGAPGSEEANPAQNNLAIIVNTANPVENLSLRELRHVFLGERAHWPNSRRITLVMMEPGQPERKALLRDVCQMSESDFTRHFLNGVFTGEVFASPKTLASPIGVRKFIFNVPGAIGYLRATEVDSTVKVIRVDGHLPTEKEYELHIVIERAER